MLDAHIIKQRRELRVDLSLRLGKGEALALVGASGAGKSTVLSCLAGLEEPDEGHVRLDEDLFFPPSMPLHRRGIGYLTQEPQLFPHLTVAKNVTFGPGEPKLEQAAWIAELRDRLRLEALWDAPAASISGGQARRVALARMLAPKPRLVLLDEPFTGLDRQLCRELIDHLLAWRQTLGFRVIAVDHQVDVLMRLCPERVVAMEAGVAIQRGSWTELQSSPATPLLASLLAPL